MIVHISKSNRFVYKIYRFWPVSQARNDPQNFQKESLYATEEIEHTEYNMQPLFMDKKTKKEDSYQN